jgi:hypothetical protein
MHLLVYGGLLVLIVLFEPKGLIGLFRRFVSWWEKRRPRLAAPRDRTPSEVGHGRTP